MVVFLRNSGAPLKHFPNGLGGRHGIVFCPLSCQVVGEQIYLCHPSFGSCCHSFHLQLLTASFLQEPLSPPGPHNLFGRTQEVGLKSHGEQRRSSNGGRLLRWGGGGGLGN